MIKNVNHLLLLIAFVLLAGCSKVKSDVAVENNNALQQQEYYQLKTYVFDTEDQVQITDRYVEQAYLPALKKLGISNVGVFKPRASATDTIKKLLVLIPLKSISQVVQLEEQLLNDETYRLEGKAYLEAPHNQPPYQHMESVLMKAFENMPVMKTPMLDGPRAERVYELRSYESATEAYAANKREMFNAGGEIAIFNQLGCNPVFFGQVVSGADMPNLMYMTAYANQQSRDEHWKAFGESEAWSVLKVMPEYQNNVSHIDISYLYPTEYSDY